MFFFFFCRDCREVVKSRADADIFVGSICKDADIFVGRELCALRFSLFSWSILDWY